jgi:hypothetical protein
MPRLQSCGEWLYASVHLNAEMRHQNVSVRSDIEFDKKTLRVVGVASCKYSSECGIKTYRFDPTSNSIKSAKGNLKDRQS